jgi:excisionase family DNA binding protein
MKEQSNFSTEAHLLGREQAAKALGISWRKLDYLRADGKIPYCRIGKRILFCPTDLEQFIEARRIPA